MEQRFIVLGSNSNNQVQAYGTSTGAPFQSEQAAQRLARKMDKRFRMLDFLVLPIHPVDQQELSTS